MSDGPHKSLPLPRRWRDLAERAANHAFSSTEVSEAMLVAVRKEFGGLPIEKLRHAMRAGDQAGLFSDAVESDLDALRVACPGNASWNALIDCSIDEIRRGGIGAEALSAACEAAVDLKLRAVSRQIEEHYLRKESSRSAFSMRQRLSDSRTAVDTASIASEICGTANRSPSNARIRKQDGLDDGVSL
jgi:hypothetical protein